MADRVTADIGFEKQIWDAACVRRCEHPAPHAPRVSKFHTRKWEND